MEGKLKAPAELDFLTSLERGEVVTQSRLSKRIDISIGLVNALLKRAIHKGYVKAKSAPYRRYAYYLTPRGFAEKSRLVATYLEDSLAFFRVARQEYAELFERARRSGTHRFVIAGSGELAEIALLAARETEATVVCVVDRACNKSQFQGVPVVQSLDDLSDVDALVIADARAPQETFDKFSAHYMETRVLAPAFLRISRVHPEFKPKVAGR